MRNIMSDPAVNVIIDPTLTAFVKYRNHPSIMEISVKVNKRNSYIF